MANTLTLQSTIIRDRPMSGPGGGACAYRRVRQYWTGLPSNGVVTLAHGLTGENGGPATPVEVNVDMTTNNNCWFVLQANNLGWDSTNIYLQLGTIAAGPHAANISITF